jgi:hypothetical protein
MRPDDNRFGSGLRALAAGKAKPGHQEKTHQHKQAFRGFHTKTSYIFFAIK